MWEEMNQEAIIKASKTFLGQLAPDYFYTNITSIYPLKLNGFVNLRFNLIQFLFIGIFEYLKLTLK